MDIKIEVLYDGGVQKDYVVPVDEGVSEEIANANISELGNVIKNSYKEGAKCYLKFGNLSINIYKTCSVNFKLII